MRTVLTRVLLLSSVSLCDLPSIAQPAVTQSAPDPSENRAADAMHLALARSVAAAFSVPGISDDTEDQSDPQQTKPPANPQQPSLNDLGFPPSATQGNPQEQARLDKRSHMLKIHQRLGLITTAPLIATVLSGAGAGGRKTSSSTRDLHAALGSTTAVLYFTTAYFSIFAPKVQGTPTRGSIRLHKALALIHGPGMVLTPVLGAMAFDQKSKGEHVHGIASAHGAVAIVTAAAYGLAIVTVSVKF